MPYDNPYLQQQIDDSLGDTVRAWNNVAVPGFGAAAIRSGSFGNSGIDQMAQDATRQFQTGLGRQANDMRSNNYQFGMNYGLANDAFQKSVFDTTFNQQQQLWNNQMGLLGLQSNANQNALGYGTNVQNAPIGYYGQFANIANGIGSGFGTSTGTQNYSGSPLMGALGGAQLGAAASKWFTGNNGTPSTQFNPWTGMNSSDIAFG